MAKHNFKKLVFEASNRKLLDFLDEFQRLSKDAFRIAAHVIFEQFINVEKPLHAEKSIIPTQLENYTYKQIVTYHEQKLEQNGLEAPIKLQTDAVRQYATKRNCEQPRPTCQHCKKPRQYKNQCRQLQWQKQQVEDTLNSFRNNKTGENIFNWKINNNNRSDKRPWTFYPPCETCRKTNHSTERCFIRANTAGKPLIWSQRLRRQKQLQQQDSQYNENESVKPSAQHSR